MPRRPLLVVLAALVTSLAILVVMGVRVFERDRDALVERFGEQREQAGAEAARDFLAEVAEIGEDVQLASVLLQSADGGVQAERDLQAIATIKREYMMMFARRGGTTTSVIAFDAPPTVAAVATPTVETMLALAERAPGPLHVSPAFGAPEGRFAWLRVVARRIDDASPTVALVVDTAVLLGRMRLGRDASTRVAIVDARGATALSNDPALVPLVARVRGTAATHVVIDEATATTLGLPPARAVAIGVPVPIDPAGPPATLILVTSTQVLGTQESTIVRRVLVGGTLILGLLVSASAYVLRNTFRARALRERTHLLERLLHSEKLVTAGQLAAGIAHEVGTPLNVARGRIELSLSKVGDDHPIAANQRTAIDQIDRVTRLLQQLLDYVRPPQLALAEVDLGRAAHAVRDLLSPQAAKRGVALQVEAPESVSLRADPDHVQQVVMNLALNAIDACEAGGTVVVRARIAPRGLVLEVSDDGHGIPPEIHQQVFDPFFTTKKRGQGTGLGLWVVAQIVRAQAGEIELTSTSAAGTTVRVAWPRSAAA